MNVEISPLSEFGTPSVGPVLLSAALEDRYSEELSEGIDTEEEEAISESEELFRYRGLFLPNDSGIGGSQDSIASDATPDSPCRGRNR